MLRIIPIAHSQNSKTGDIAQTYTGAQTCPKRCPFRDGNGCYGEVGFTNFTFSRATKGEGLAPSELYGWIAANTDRGALIRHNVCGDIAKPGTSTVDKRLLETLTKAYFDRRAYTYTHCAITKRNSELLKQASHAGFVINYSCEMLAECDKALDDGVPAVLAVTKFDSLPERTPGGRKFVLCPAQAKQITCRKCKLCAVGNRQTIVVFETHGAQRKRADAAICRANSRKRKEENEEIHCCR